MQSILQNLTAYPYGKYGQKWAAGSIVCCIVADWITLCLCGLEPHSGTHSRVIQGRLTAVTNIPQISEVHKNMYSLLKLHVSICGSTAAAVALFGSTWLSSMCFLISVPLWDMHFHSSERKARKLVETSDICFYFCSNVANVCILQQATRQGKSNG